MDVTAAKHWPAAKIEKRPRDSLRAYERNARTHSPAQIAQIAAAIREWGWTVPILIQPDGTIIAGHGRVMAAEQLGIEEIPVMVAQGWSPAQIRAYVIADNKLAENASWDEELLQLELGDLAGMGFDLSVTGFSAEELTAIAAIGAGGTNDPEATPEPPAIAATQAGDVWLLGGHRLVCGDATEKAAVEACVRQERPNLMVTDPPYGVEYDPTWRKRAGVNIATGKMGRVANDDRSDWRDAWALFPGNVAYIWHAGLHSREVQNSLEACSFQVRSQIIWAKDRFALSRGDYHWQHEPCWYAVRKGAKGGWEGDRAQSTLWVIPSREDGGHGHSTQKPVECMKRPMVNNSRAGDAVYEPFCGSGTSIIAGEITGRRVLAIELNPVYVDVAVKRWQNFTGKIATLEKTGEPFKAAA